jgi:hypothetical protein
MRKKAKIKHPFATLYYTDPMAKVDAYSSQGTTKSEDGFKRAGAVKLILGQYAKVIVIDRRTGVIAYTLRRTLNGISIHYGDSAMQVSHLRRVK